MKDKLKGTLLMAAAVIWILIGRIVTLILGEGWEDRWQKDES